MEMDYNEQQLVKKIQQLESELLKMKERVVHESLEEKGLDLYTRRVETTVGTKSEIDKVTEELIKLNEELNKYRQEKRIREVNSQIDKKRDDALRGQREKSEIDHEQLVEQLRIQTFNRVKNQYKSNRKNDNLWYRIVDRLRGETPNWDRISKYSKEELEYLLKVAEGKTAQQQKMDQHIRDTYKGKYNEQEMRKREKSSHWSSFKSRLNSTQTRINQEMKMEERGRTL